MSKYTTQVRFICENYANLENSVGYDSVDNVIDSAMDKVFDFEYPIFDESYKGVLQKKILKHYYTREIGAETVGLWKLWLNTRMNEIMPYYNELYKSAKYEFNPLHDVDITRTHEGSGTNDGNTAVSNETLDKFSDTPQGTIENLRSEDYVTNASIVNNSGTSNTNIKTTDEYVERVTGKQGSGSYSSLIKEYRDILLNIDMMIINELSDLFFGLW